MDQFDGLKREATKLERTLEDKVSRYQQVRMAGEFCMYNLNQQTFANPERMLTRCLSAFICFPASTACSISSRYFRVERLVAG